MFHPYALSSTAMSTSRSTAIAAPPLCLWSKEFYETDPDARLRARLHASSSAAASARSSRRSPARPTGLLPWGEDHHAVYRSLLNGHRIGLSAICEDLPEEHNRVTLDPVLKDGNGIPAPKIDYTISDNSRRMMEHGIARGEGDPGRRRRHATSASRARS